MKKQTMAEEDGMQQRCSRSYRLGQREAAMEATRGRVLGSARKLILGENALADFSMEAVARLAGITRVTVYEHFGSKRGLLEALFDDMGTRNRLGEKLPAVFAQPNALDALQGYIETFCGFWESERALTRRLRGFAALDGEFAEAIAARDERRHQAIATLLLRLSEREAAFSPPIREEMLQTLLALTSFEFYDVLAGERVPQEVAPIVFRLVLMALGLVPMPTGTRQARTDLPHHSPC